VFEYDICMTVKSIGITLTREEENDDTGRNLWSVSFLEVWRTGVRGGARRGRRVPVVDPV